MSKTQTRHDELREAAQQFHNEHPEVWDLFRQYTFDRIHHGHKNYGAKTIMERVRWETGAGGPEFKINNNLTAFYSRRFMAIYPQYEGFFRTRRQISKNADAVDLPELAPNDYATYPNDLGRVAS